MQHPWRKANPWREEVVLQQSWKSQTLFMLLFPLPFGCSSTGENRNFCRERCNRKELLSWKYHVFVDFVSNDRNAVFFTNLQQPSNMVLREDRSTRIGRIVVNDGNSIAVNLWLQVIQINLPRRVRKKVVGSILGAISSTESLVKREPRPRNEDVLSRRS